MRAGGGSSCPPSDGRPRDDPRVDESERYPPTRIPVKATSATAACAGARVAPRRDAGRTATWLRFPPSVQTTPAMLHHQSAHFIHSGRRRAERDHETSRSLYFLLNQ